MEAGGELLGEGVGGTGPGTGLVETEGVSAAGVGDGSGDGLVVFGGERDAGGGGGSSTLER